MTAINVLLEPHRAHVFADGGHFSGKVLRRIAVKTYPLPDYNAVLAWSGPSDDVCYVLNAVKLSGAATLPDLLIKLPTMIAGLGWKHPFSAILVGVFGGAAMGVTVEQEGKVTPLAAWNTVRALPSAVQFDPADIVGSGLRMMDDQRSVHGIVAGFVQHVVVEADRIDARVLKRWPDLVIGGGLQTHAAKITELEVDKITFDKLALNATIGCMVSSIVNGGSVVVPNEEDLPVIFSIYFQTIYTGSGGSSWARLNWALTRTRGSVQAASGGVSKQGSSSYTIYMNSSGIDSTSENNDTYTLNLTVSTLNGGNMAASNGKLKATYIKR